MAYERGMTDANMGLGKLIDRGGPMAETGRRWRCPEIAHYSTGSGEARTGIAAACSGGRAIGTVDYEPVPDWFTGMVAATSSLGATA